MEKVKIFTVGTSDAFDSLENEINEWLAEKRGAASFSILSRTMSTCAGVNVAGDGFVNCTIVVFYKE